MYMEDMSTTDGPNKTVRLTWTTKDDPRGFIARMVEAEILIDALEAIGDPMPFAAVDGLKDQVHAENRLQSVLWTIQELQDRADRLTVALRDTYQAPWSRVSEVIALGEQSWPPKRATAQGRYRAGKKRINAGADTMPGPLALGEFVRVISETAYDGQYTGREGVIVGRVAESYVVAGLTGRVLDTMRGAPAFTADQLQPAVEYDQESHLDPRLCTCDKSATTSHAPNCGIFNDDQEDDL